MYLLGLKACELINKDLKQALVLILFRKSNIAAPKFRFSDKKQTETKEEWIQLSL